MALCAIFSDTLMSGSMWKLSNKELPILTVTQPEGGMDTVTCIMEISYYEETIVQKVRKIFVFNLCACL